MPKSTPKWNSKPQTRHQSGIVYTKSEERPKVSASSQTLKWKPIPQKGSVNGSDKTQKESVNGSEITQIGSENGRELPQNESESEPPQNESESESEPPKKENENRSTQPQIESKKGNKHPKNEAKTEQTARFFQPAKNSFFLFGPRGTGKSTWLKEHCPQAVFIDLLSPKSHLLYSANPERLTERINDNPEKTLFIIDEVQKIPPLLDVVHQIMEEKNWIKFILTCSSTRQLNRTEVNLLAGRAVLKTMHPFMASELGKAFGINKALQNGLLPLIVNSTDIKTILDSYVSLYIREEVQMEGEVRNIGNFARFLERVTYAHASVLNISDISRECAVERKTVQSYIEILEDLLLAFRIPVFSQNAKRILIKHPKFYFFDAGVFRSLRPSGPFDSPVEIDSCALEGLIAQHLMAWNAYSNNNNSISFWRTKSGNEVDFIISGPNCLWAIEVKNDKTVNNKDLKGLVAFKEDYPECKTILLYRGDKRIKVKNILCVPCEEFLLKLDPKRSLDECLFYNLEK